MKLWQPEGSPLAYALEGFVNEPNTPYVIIAGMQVPNFMNERYCVNWFEVGDTDGIDIFEQMRKDLKSLGDIVGESSGALKGEVSNRSHQGPNEIHWRMLEYREDQMLHRTHFPSHPGWVDEGKKHPHRPMANRTPEELLSLFQDRD